MRVYDIIYRKRDKQELTKQEIGFMVSRYNNGDIPDYQMSAFLMSVFFNSMTDDEIFYLTTAIVNSGDRLDLSSIEAPIVDKHSTGGVGDGTTLIVVPIAASLGICVPSMAGRGLGHTGGTIDKLESIPGFRTNTDKKEFLGYLNYAGAAIVSQNSEIAPADKKLYVLRDATASVESVPLICASIMSKKIAEGTKALVLDVKVGDGAFMKNFSDAKTLAKKMLAIGKRFNMNVSAILTDMNTPLGNCAGNSIEVKQAIEILKSNLKNDLYELSLALAGLMILICKKATSLEQAKQMAQQQIDNGKALEKFREIIKMQGGNPKVIDYPDKALPQAKNSLAIKADKNGFISNMRVRNIGVAGMLLGAGRERKEDAIDASAGIIFNKKTGDFVEKGEIIAELLYNSPKNIEAAENIMKDSYLISDSKNEYALIKEFLL
jgi:pyrimidine-nucleoside phosphorylase